MVAPSGIRADPSRFGVGRSDRRSPGVLAVPVVMLLLLTGFAAAPVRAPVTSVPRIWTSEPGTALTTHPSAATHWGESPVLPSGIPWGGGSKVPLSAQTGAGLNATGCNSTLAWTVVGAYSLNLTFNSTPSNGSDPAPLTFTWNLTVYEGGLPPYSSVTTLMGPNWTYSSDDFTGNVTILQPGTYQVNVFVSDATCTQFGELNFPIMAWGSIGPHPLTVNASSTATSVGVPVHFTATTARLPANWSILWTTPFLYSNDSWVNHTYYLPGLYTATACYVEPDATIYACATSPVVNVTGPNPIVTGSVGANGTGAVNVTFWANVTNSSLLPANSTLYLYAWNGSDGVWAYSSTGNISLNETVGCGYPWTSVVPVAGVCEWTAVVSVLGPLGGIDGGHLLTQSITANVGYTGSLANWYPSLSLSYGPLNGTVPVNVSLNFSVTSGIAPYEYFWDAFGRSSVNTSGAVYPILSGNSTGWNGSRRTVVVSLPRVGVYWIELFVADRAHNLVDQALPLVYVGNVSVYVPLPLQVQASLVGTNSTTPGSTVQFVAEVSGGLGPYSVQWSFGDGTFGSSVPGQTISHSYSTPGNYTVLLTITDARGVVQSSQLPVQSIALSSPGHQTYPSGPIHSAPPGGWEWAGLIGVGLAAAALITTAVLWSRRELRREGEELVESADFPTSRGSESPVQ